MIYETLGAPREESEWTVQRIPRPDTRALTFSLVWLSLTFGVEVLDDLDCGSLRMLCSAPRRLGIKHVTYAHQTVRKLSDTHFEGI